MDPFFYLIIIAGAIAGGGTAYLGVFIVGMRMPFIGTCISHAAMAGTVLAVLTGINPTIGAAALSIASAVSLAALPPHRSRIDNNVGLAVLFSLMLGLTFLGIGLVNNQRSDLLGMLWGSLLFVQKDSVLMISAGTLAMLIFSCLFSKELKLILFSREIAVTTGIHHCMVYCLFLALCGFILSVNLKLIGGLMIFALTTNPAAAAYQICKGYRSVVAVSTLFGILSTVAGFLISYYFNLPTGASIVLVSTFIFALCAVINKVFSLQ
ncbi:MAG: metal ABC transporter permease [Sedimentisphaeraceae bacterium JB056]